MSNKVKFFSYEKFNIIYFKNIIRFFLSDAVKHGFIDGKCCFVDRKLFKACWLFSVRNKDKISLKNPIFLRFY